MTLFNVKLKSCPFCGADAFLDGKLDNHDRDFWGYDAKIQCCDCFAEIDYSRHLISIKTNLTKEQNDQRKRELYVEAVDDVVVAWNSRQQ